MKNREWRLESFWPWSRSCWSRAEGCWPSLALTLFATLQQSFRYLVVCSGQDRMMQIYRWACHLMFQSSAYLIPLRCLCFPFGALNLGNSCRANLSSTLVWALLFVFWQARWSSFLRVSPRTRHYPSSSGLQSLRSHSPRRLKGWCLVTREASQGWWCCFRFANCDVAC